MVSHGCLVGVRNATGQQQREPLDRQQDLAAASDLARSRVRHAAEGARTVDALTEASATMAATPRQATVWRHVTISWGSQA